MLEFLIYTIWKDNSKQKLELLLILLDKCYTRYISFWKAFSNTDSLSMNFSENMIMSHWQSARTSANSVESISVVHRGSTFHGTCLGRKSWSILLKWKAKTGFQGSEKKETQHCRMTPNHLNKVSNGAKIRN